MPYRQDDINVIIDIENTLNPYSPLKRDQEVVRKIDALIHDERRMYLVQALDRLLARVEAVKAWVAGGPRPFNEDGDFVRPNLEQQHAMVENTWRAGGVITEVPNNKFHTRREAEQFARKLSENENSGEK
jgi:hypothetical protein